MLAEITQNRIDEAQRQAEIDQLNESNKGGIILSSKKKLKSKPPPPQGKKYLSPGQIADLGQEKINIPLLRNKQKKSEEIANLLSQYSRDTLLQIAKDNGISQKNAETKQNLLERMYSLDPNKISWNNYEKLKKSPKK